MHTKKRTEFIKRAGTLALAAVLLSGTPVSAATTAGKPALQAGQEKIPAVHGAKKETITLKGTKGKNASEVAAIKKIFRQQKDFLRWVADMPDEDYKLIMNLNSEYYGWNKKGRLTRIGLKDNRSISPWPYFKGKVSLSAFPELRVLILGRGKLTRLDISKNKKLTTLACAD